MNNIETKNYKRVNKKQAEKLYKQGKTFFMCACKVDPESLWGLLCEVKNNNEKSFDTFINNFSYYNCNTSELGKYPAYYIKKSMEV